MSVTIRKLPSIWCAWDGCPEHGSWGVFDNDEFIGDFCKRHANAEKRRIEKAL